ncbi:MAG TPA: glycosyltransferase family protein [Candidatus Eisenbacteria bacterium]|nr:glycosyltransferase family protein [Candidatus Eisenbacteria bacterium]
MKKMMNKTGVIIQARLGSTRLPGKVLLDLQGYPVLYHVFKRMQQIDDVDVVIATSQASGDDQIEEFCMKNDVACFRGSEENVLERFYQTAVNFDFDTIVRITSDCPLIDPKIAADIIDFYNNSNCDLATNGGSDPANRTFPRGMDVSVFSFEVLEEAYKNARSKAEKEHVTPYIYEHKEVAYFKQDKDQSYYRLTLDTREDFELIQKIYEELYKEGEIFYLKDVIDLLEKKPELSRINQDVKQKKA